MIHVVRYDENDRRLHCQYCGGIFEPTEAEGRRRFRFKYQVGQGDEPCTLGVSVSDVITIRDKPQ